MIESRVPVTSKAFKVEQFDNEILLYAAEEARAVHLNETAFLLWQLCDEKRTVGEIISLLQEEYPEQKQEVREDVIAAVSILVDSGALLLENGQDGSW